MAYNESLANALIFAEAIDGASLTTTTSPTLAQATSIWTRSYQSSRLGLRMAGLDPDTVTADSAADELARTAEAYLTSGRALLTKATVVGGESMTRQGTLCLEQAAQILGRPGKDGEWIPGELQHMRQMLISEGAAVELEASETARATSWQTEALRPGQSLAIGDTGIGYPAKPTFSNDGSL